MNVLKNLIKYSYSTLYLLVFLVNSCQLAINPDDNLPIDERVEKNYGEPIKKLSERFMLQPEYLKALTVIECSGRSPAPPRFEQGIFDKLSDLQNEKIQKFENITPDMLKGLTEAELKDLATSWGPFQLMGYKCFWLGIDIEDIKGNMNMFYAAKWINKTYGKYVRMQDYKDAFHIHNTGKRFPEDGIPLTHDPEYVKNGLKYLEIFRIKDSLDNIILPDTIKIVF